MCGIAGIFDTSARREIDRELLRSMRDALVHRGPDDGGELFAPGVALGHRRLSIIDLSGGHQPLYNEDDSVGVVFNGEIYNFPELTVQLKAAGHRFRTHSDTEVIVHAWEEWGEQCVAKFNGMFAFAVWDANRDCVFLARDRLGKKPLYYTRLADGRLAFASELKALLVVPGLDRTLDEAAIEEYLALGYVPDPRSILRSVKKLPPASTLLLTRGGECRPRAYWDVSFEYGQPQSQADIEAELMERLREAVRIRLMSEVPLGAFLSGGVDSSAVVAMMAGLSSGAVNTCSISFGDPQFNESAYAESIARKFATHHHVEQVDADDFDLVDRLARVYDEPFADSSAMPTYRVCELARRSVTVALSGDGGDETLAGYRRYRWHMHEERVRSRLPLGVRRALFGTLGWLYPKIDWAPKFLRAKSTLESIARDSLEGYFHSVSVMPDRVRLPLYSRDFLHRLSGYRAIEVFREHAARGKYRDPLSMIQYIDFKTYLPGDILVKVDRAAMAHSLEVRVPILDYTLVDWAASLPPQLKLHGGEGKYVFKRALTQYLPNDILYRPKMGFGVPIAQWFRGPLRNRVTEALLGRGLLQTGIFERAPLQRLVEEYVSGARDHSAALWALLMFESCCRQVLGAA